MARPSDVVRDKKVLNDLYAISEKDREELLEWIGSLGVPEAAKKALAKGTDLDRMVDGWYRHCNSSVKVRYPDYKGMAAFFKLLFEYKLQKPSELKELRITGRIEHTTKELEQMSDADLLELAAEDADWTPRAITSK